MMTYNVLTLFPEMFDSIKSASIWSRAIEAELIAVNAVNIRNYTVDKHRRADDYTFGGGSGMVMKPEPIHSCFNDVESGSVNPYINIYMSPCGKQLNHELVKELLGYSTLNILCGHYEGVDARVLERHIDLEISVGDFVLTGGEIAAMALIDACIRHIEGVLGNSDSAETESFTESLLEYPQFTRPPEFEGSSVPEVLISGHHAKVEEYRRKMSLRETAKKRPDLLLKAILTKKDIEFITEK